VKRYLLQDFAIRVEDLRFFKPVKEWFAQADSIIARHFHYAPRYTVVTMPNILSSFRGVGKVYEHIEISISCNYEATYSEEVRVSYRKLEKIIEKCIAELRKEQEHE